jgi:phosphohistidine phosphatase
MLTLSLLRHAKSSWDDGSLEDFERPLAKRGESAAPRMGAFMAEQGLAPQLILCSPAVRARQTLELLLPELSGSPTVEYEEAFYLAAPSVLLGRVRKIGPKVHHVMIVGHDPGMQGLATDLAGTGDAEALAALARKFPTAGLAVIRFKAREWAKIGPGKGHLDIFMTPKTLPS